MAQIFNNDKTACEKSEHKAKIDQWLNEGKSASWISKQLTNLGEKISDKSVGKYRRKREEMIHEELMQDPAYKHKMDVVNQTLTDEVSKIKPVNVMNQLSTMIEHCAKLIGEASMEEIKIKNIKDLRFVQQTMLESIRLYGDMTMQAQKFGKIEEDPSLLKPTQNINVKQVIGEMIGGMEDGQRTELIDRLRAVVSQPQ